MKKPSEPSPARAGQVEPGTGTPRWVKIFGIITIVLVLLFFLLLLGGPEHGPARHTSSGSPPAQQSIR